MSNQVSDESVSVGIVGLGLIGGSIGLALRHPKRTILGCDASSEAQSVALERLCVDRIAPLEEVSQCDIVFLGVPPALVYPVLKNVYKVKASETVVTDTSSVKGEIARLAHRDKMIDFVPGHPMAGHEKTGSRYASAWLYKGARWILTPNRDTRASATRRVKKLIQEMGATAVQLDPEEHDHQVALFSHLPHVVAGALVLEAAEMTSSEIAAGSWKDLTRVGGVDPRLWTQILYGNREELAKTIDRLMVGLSQVREMLGEDGEQQLLAWLTKAQQAKAAATPAEAPAAKPSRGAIRSPRRK